MFVVQAWSTTFGRRPAARHLVVIAAVNPLAGVLGHRTSLAWSTAVERLHQVRKLEVAGTFLISSVWGEIRVHLIVRSLSEMDCLTTLYWNLVNFPFLEQSRLSVILDWQGRAYQSFADDTQFAFYLRRFDDMGFPVSFCPQVSS